jgi:hypothetical protein
MRLLCAGAYKALKHDVLEVEAAPLFAAYQDKIWLCPINSGCTKPFPHPRDLSTFQRLQTYPYAEWVTKRRGKDPVVELCIDYAVPDIAKYTTRVVSMCGGDELETIFVR